jgi:hypothetical protein
MTPRYEFRTVGVLDRELGEVIVPASGAPWDDYHAWLAAGGVPDPEPAPEPVSLEEALANKLAEIEDRAASQRRLVTGAVSPQEMSSWGLKLTEANAFDTAAGDSSAPMLAAEAKVRGVATAEIVARVLANANDYMHAEAAIAGTSGRHKDAVRQLAKVEQVLAYDAAAGWPFNPPPQVLPFPP